MARILIIEDDPEQRYLITEMLDFCNHRTVAISDGAAALDLLRRDDDFAAVFSDIQLPRLDGEYLVSAIKSGYPHIPLVIVSVYANLDWLKQGIQQGEFFHLQKPYSIDQLQAVLDAVIHSHQGG